MEFKHKSVLLDETIEALNIKPDGIYLDGTLGGGGHSYEICRRLGDGGYGMTVMRYDIGFGITGVYGRLEYLYALFGKFCPFLS